MLCDPAIPLLGIHLDKTIIQKDTCAAVFIAAEFTIAKTWQKLKCSSRDESIKRGIHMCARARTHTHTRTMEYCLTTKKNEIMPFTVVWTDLEVIILSEVSQTKTNIIQYRLYMASNM